MIEALKVVAVAFAVVFVGMGVLTGLVYALDAIKRVAARRAEPLPESGLDPRTTAVLAAAVHAALGRPARIHRVHVHRERDDEAWVKVGRMDLLLTHRVQPRQSS